MVHHVYTIDLQTEMCKPVFNLAFTVHGVPLTIFYFGDGLGHEQLISNGGGFKPAFAERDKKQTMIDLRKIYKNWFENQLCPSKGS
jgi:hypothetical protein